MMRTFSSLALVAAVLTFIPAIAGAQEDVSGFYEVTTAGSTQKLKSGAQGTLVIAITTKAGAHISDEAPLKIELTGKNVTPSKAKLTRADSVSKKPAGKEFVDPRFEVPFAAAAAGKGSVEAKMTFFVCTEKLCTRQQKTLSVPVQVD